MPFKKQGLVHLKCNSVYLHMRHASFFVEYFFVLGTLCYIPVMPTITWLIRTAGGLLVSGLQFLKWWCKFLSCFCNLNLKHSQDFRMSDLESV